MERWRPLVHTMGVALRRSGLPSPSDAQLLAQIDQESAGHPRARSVLGAVGLGQVMSNSDARFPDRPSEDWLVIPYVNLAIMLQMMGDAMRRSKARGDRNPWDHGLLEYYTGSLDGWDRAFGGHSGRDYVRLVTAKVPGYTRLPSWLRR